MHEVFDEEDFKPGPHRRDKEVTLGPMLLLGLFFGLVLLCGLSFGLGYTIGSHSSHNALAAQQSGAQAALPTAGSLPKPSATSQVPSQSQGAASGQSATDAADAGSQNAGTMPATSANSASPVVRPALPAVATSTPASGQPAPAPKAASAGAFMVQVAVVSHQEDADVLVGALRRRGYAATAHRDAADGQFHVRIGPFSNHNDANSTRQKLLGDGYNAVVQQ